MACQQVSEMSLRSDMVMNCLLSYETLTCRPFAPVLILCVPKVKEFDEEEYGFGHCVSKSLLPIICALFVQTIFCTASQRETELAFTAGLTQFDYCETLSISISVET